MYMCIYVYVYIFTNISMYIHVPTLTIDVIAHNIPATQRLLLRTNFAEQLVHSQLKRAQFLSNSVLRE